MNDPNPIARIGRALTRLFLFALLVPILLLLGACILSPTGTSLVIEGVEQETLVTASMHRSETAVWASGRPEAQRVIYVHGTPGSASAFRAFLESPVPGTRSIAYDRPGFGETTPKEAVVSFEQQAKVIEPMLTQSDHGRWPILVGHSLGGPIIARAAADYPEKVGGLVIVAGSLDPALEKPRWFNHAADFPLVRPFLGSSLRHSNEEIMAAPEQTELLDAVLKNVRCPVVIVHGTDDGLVPYENVEYMKNTFTNAASIRVVTLENEGHFIIWSHEDEVREAIESLTTGHSITDGAAAEQ